ncbi:BMP family protein [Desulfonatronum sp. SC1]|uniref:BMP family lipoprotein n=1 Tax=Desulfonatronum sp. SC1 TaxID=2109626 RepID=UPI000D307A1A|nr:BMP family ABC transporter substrate-binding protein [Desulfonatronum sp. SC1]PTN31827.1 BMP family ABC transporter substrate-binding protein [Desulfonatronum sp. SC1]
MIFVLLLLIAITVATTGAATGVAIGEQRVGIVFSTGGLGDLSFNDAALHGLRKAKEDMGISFQFIDPRGDEHLHEHLKSFALEDYDLVIANGFQLAPALEQVARDFPHIRFAIIDSVVPAPNVTSLLFMEHDGSFLVGVLAGMMTQSNIVGFVGGLEVPIIRKFQGGFEQGVAFVNADAQVLVDYAGSFSAPALGNQLATSQHERGADIVYHASGGTGLGVIFAAQENGFYAIGVDSAQDHLAPGTVLTSMVKRVDVAVYETIRSLVEGNLQPGERHFGVAEGGVGTSDFQYTRDIIPQAVLDAVASAKAKIISGEIVVLDPTK